VELAFAAPKSMAKKNGSQQEYNDGVTALIAVCVLLTATPTRVVLPLHIDLCVLHNVGSSPFGKTLGLPFASSYLL
jgi:hypothetical protein